MELTNEFSVKVPIDEAWAVLTDLERVAPCMPGFELQEVAGDEYRGAVKVKVGPILAQYEGVASFQERDEASHRAVVHARGREARGQGSARAVVTATLAPREGGTHVSVHTDLTITGRLAQFGRGVLADVSGKLLRQFVENLEADLLSGSREDAAPGREDPEPAPSAGTTARPATAAPVDLLAAAGSSVMKRLGPVALLVAALAAGLWLLLRD